ncbi:MAG: MBL fold metallo-hydrolase [Candidatus Pacebacteria bacterium]|nr:MBL fold metallo-hydrolase [Candidatus Paceibacterota bacterium]
MKIKKLGHCCFVVDINGVRIMTDPSNFNYGGDSVLEKDISLILFTHEHGDHLHIDTLKEILKNNEKALIISNGSVGKLLTEAGIEFTKVEDGESYDFEGIRIKGFGDKHAQIYEDYGQVQNTGYMINDLCYPGDSFSLPNTKVDILALPVLGPWMMMKNAIDYAKEVKPRVVFPVHDGTLKPFATFVYGIPEHFLSKVGITFKKLEIGVEEDL